MSEIIQVRLLQIQASGAASWRQALHQACVAAGWRFYECWDDQPPAMDIGQSGLMISWSAEGPLDGAVWVVQSCRPQAAVATLARLFSLSEVDALYHASARFALASALVEKGALYTHVSDTVMTVPGLGQVRMVPVEGDGATDDGGTENGPLAYYERLPPPIGASAHWGAEIFAYPDGGECRDGRAGISLLGRRRLLLNGPNLSLTPGVWEARARFAIDPQDHADVLIEWGYGVETAQLTHVFDVAGHYEITLTQEWEEAAPADFRISLMTPALEGTLWFEGVDLRRISDTTDGTLSVGE